MTRPGASMPINVTTWLGRLTVECPGWYFWHSPEPFPDKPWHGVPAPPGRRPAGHLMRLPGRIDTDDPKKLRNACRERPSWDDNCDMCGGPVQACGHWTPKTTRPW